MPRPESQILMYQPEEGRTRFDVRLENETVWLSHAPMAPLFQTSKQNASLQIRNILSDEEFRAEEVVKDYLTIATDGKAGLVRKIVILEKRHPMLSG